MPNLIPPVFPLDLTGLSINNKIVNEPHVLNSKKIRSLVPFHSPFFTESLKVYDSVGPTLLTRGVNYNCVDVIGLPTAQSGKEICAIIIITDTSVSDNVYLEYQTLGGYYVRSYASVKLLLENLTNDSRSVKWPDIANRPTIFDPNMHLHRIGDVIGFEYMVNALEQLKVAVGLGDDIGHDEMLQYIDDNITSLMALVNDTQSNNINMAVVAAANAQSGAVTALNATVDLQTTVTTRLSEAQSVLTKSYALITNMENAEEEVLAAQY